MNTVACTALVPFQLVAAPASDGGATATRVLAPTVLFRAPRSPLRLTRHRKRSLFAAVMAVAMSLWVGAAAGAVQPTTGAAHSVAAPAAAAPGALQVSFRIQLP